MWQFGAEMLTSEIPLKEAETMDIYFTDAGEVPSAVYHYNTATRSETRVYTRPEKRLYSFLFAPWDPEKLYFVNAN